MRYDFHDFIQRMAKLDYIDILKTANAECGHVESQLSGVRGAPQRRKEGGVEHAAKIKRFLYYMRYGDRPGGISDGEFSSYRPAVEALIAKGQFKKEALDRLLSQR
jgi:hypothetical protein